MVPTRHAHARRVSTWPFMATRSNDEAFPVPERQEVEFGDGVRLWLRRIWPEGATQPDRFVRIISDATAEGLRVDLRRVIPEFERRVPSTTKYDVASWIARELRSRYATRDEFVEFVVKNGALA